MSGFKLLAIRPFLNCDARFSKNLKKGVIYKFYQNYDFLDKEKKVLNEESFVIKDSQGNLIDNDVYFIRKNKEVLDDIYGVTTSDGHEIDVQVSALVGKNGSGKSTLLELLYGVCYIIALKKGIIPDHSKLGKLINNKDIDHNKLFGKINDIQDVYSDLMVEVYYEIDGKYFSIWYNSQQEISHRALSEGFQHHSFNEYGGYRYNESIDEKFNYVFNEFFFYTISINYSLYGLNSRFNNSWLNDLFHKNDGYQTPLVINPFRQDGNIDVNSELHLAQSRLLSNLVDDNFIDKRIVNDKKVEEVIFELDYNKYNTFGVYDFEIVYDKLKKKLGLSNSDFVTKVYNALYTDRSTRIKINLENIDNSEILVKYVYRKILKIYSNYEEYLLLDTRDINTIIPSFLQIFKGLISLRKDKSHITLKLRQILNSIRFNTLRNGEDFNWIEESDDYQKEPDKIKKHFFRIDTNSFIGRIKRIKQEFPSFEIIELIPAACFRPNLFIKNYDKDSSTSKFNNLSSGEQHFIHSLQSVFYHMINLNSVFLSERNKIKYNNINLVFDEIELYYHPEFQRRFVYEILNGIGNLKIEFIKGVNILFSTHSPFILSDIPHDNVLRLDEGYPRNSKDEEKTFGANIHELLGSSFFLENGFVGEFVKQKIEFLIQKYSNKNYSNTKEVNKSNELDFINLIDDKLIRDRLMDMHNGYYMTKTDLIENLDLYEKWLESELERIKKSGNDKS
ncbi:AAA family ATPase [Aquimarina sp. 2201CG1-2-11]|uniref:AAA family ATPase n=1 Tax=Aquimarina discodermiae TaxID=3231043 RepID=UPI0034619791